MQIQQIVGSGMNLQKTLCLLDGFEAIDSEIILALLLAGDDEVGGGEDSVGNDAFDLGVVLAKLGCLGLEDAEVVANCGVFLRVLFECCGQSFGRQVVLLDEHREPGARPIEVQLLYRLEGGLPGGDLMINMDEVLDIHIDEFGDGWVVDDVVGQALGRILG